MPPPSSNWQIIWKLFCEQVARDPSPFEIAEITPELSRRLGVPEPEAAREVGFLLVELQRLPEGGQLFLREGNAVVAQPEFQALPNDLPAREAAYPFEI